jgi:hypothetical protein
VKESVDAFSVMTSLNACFEEVMYVDVRRHFPVIHAQRISNGDSSEGTELRNAVSRKGVITENFALSHREIPYQD